MVQILYVYKQVNMAIERGDSESNDGIVNKAGGAVSETSFMCFLGYNLTCVSIFIQSRINSIQA